MFTGTATPNAISPICSFGAKIPAAYPAIVIASVIHAIFLDVLMVREYHDVTKKKSPDDPKTNGAF